MTDMDASEPTQAGVEEMVAGVLGGERRALARAITLIESGRSDHRETAEALLNALLPKSGGAIRLGVTGPPGVGKSTFIEAFGLHLVQEGKRVAVLAVDPSSGRSGGSILGDKTRMSELSRHKLAYIRPSPSGGTLGGVARRTREAMIAVEAAGFDVVIVETVGVGQSETKVAAMVDMFVLLLAPGGGDELQGIKRGIMELADLIVVNKFDGDLAAAAGRVAADYKAALGLIRPAGPHWTPLVETCSALAKTGMAEIWTVVERHQAALEGGEGLTAHRARQARDWLWSEIENSLLAAFRDDPAVAARLAELEQGVAGGEMTPSTAALELLAVFRRRK